MGLCRLYFDGACKRNPGPSGLGWVYIDSDNKVSFGWKYLGYGTNNEAEYKAVIEGLTFVQRHKHVDDRLEVYGDSNLVVLQVTGEWDCSSPNLIELHADAKRLALELNARLIHILRKDNECADALANKAVLYKNERVVKDVVVDIDLKTYLKTTM